MKIEIGKTYISDEYGDEVKVNNINGDKISVTITKNIGDKYQVKCDSLLSRNNPLIKSLKPIDSTGKQLLIKEYDYIRLPLHTQHLHEYINDLLTVYNAVSIQITAECYILQCERLEDK